MSKRRIRMPSTKPGDRLVEWNMGGRPAGGISFDSGTAFSWILSISDSPDVVHLINTAPQRRMLLRALLKLVGLLFLFLLLSFNLIAGALLIPFYLSWLYVYIHFVRIWSIYAYSKFILCVCTLLLLATCLLMAPIVRSVISALYVWLFAR